MDLTHYEAQPGDTVATLADRFDISESTIIWTNNLAADGHLEPGQRLVILPVSGILYTAQAGDTLADIARRFQSDDGAIAQVNQLVDPTQVVAGAQLIVPGGRPESVSPAVQSSQMPIQPVVDSNASSQSNVLPPSPAVIVEPQPTTVVQTISDQMTNFPLAQGLLPAVPAAIVSAPVVPVPLVPVVYNVVPGDTLLSIADKFGVSGDSIAAASGIQGNADVLLIDQKLVIPPVPGVVHVVQEGDTLSTIAERYGASSDEIVKANVIADPSILVIGTTLVVPGGKVPAPAAPAAATTTYIVQDGDNLSSIAATFSVDPQDLASANGLSDPSLLQAGQKIWIRGGTPPVQHSTKAAQEPAPTASKPAAPKPAPAAAPATPKPAPAAAPAAGPSGWDIVATASKYLGFPYVWGATGPRAFDCSGFVWYVYRKVGNPIPRDMWGQYQSGTHVSRANLQPGDIVFFAGTYGSGLSHNGIYIGGGRFIAAADYGIGVSVSSFTNYYLAHYYGAVRPW